MSSTMTYLELESGKKRVRLELSGEVFLIGRNPRCTLVLDDPQVSREHARIVRDRGGFAVEDLQSRHGTLLNGRKITGLSPLQVDDVIVICGHVLTFYSPPADPGETADFAGDPTPLIMSTRDAVNMDDKGRVRPEVKLRALLEITSSLQSTLLLGEVLPRILDSVFHIFPQAQWGAILLLDPAGQLVPMASRSRGREIDGSARVSQTIVRQAFERKQAILSADARQDDQFEPSPSISAYDIRSVLCAPMFDKGGRPLGILQLHSEEAGHPFTGEDLELVVSVAGAVGMVVENARLHQDLLERQRLQREAELARDVQRRFLPASEPHVPGYEFHGYYGAARLVGGDYYGFIPLPGGRLAIALGDVSGKGIPAAMLMARLSSDVRYSVIASPDPAAALESVNRSLAEAEIEDKFITLLLMVLDPQRHTVTVANAGHLLPLLRRPDGRLEEIGGGSAGWPLNVDLEHRYRAVSATLEPGASVLAYTDGLSEARDRGGNLYGQDRLRALFLEAPAAPAAAGKALVEGILSFAAGEPQHDDMTLVCFGRALPS